MARIPQLVWFGLWNSLVVLSRYLQNHGSLIIMNRFSTPVDVNCFSLGRSMNREANQLWEPVRASLSPPLTAMYATGNWGRLRKAYCTGGRYAIWMVMAVVTPMVVFRHEFIRLYAGAQYRQAAPVLLFWLLPIPFQLVNVMLPQIARAQARLKGLALRTLCVRVVSLIAIVVVVRFFHGSSLDAAIAFAGCSIVGEIALIWPHGNRLLDVGMGQVLSQVIGPGVVPAGLTLTVLLAIRSVYLPHTWQQLAAAATVGGLAYLGGVLLALRADDRQGLLSLLKRGLARV
jgi:O-antigen/teichoic acid export membrane protein